MTLYDALKKFRRGAHVYGPAWRALVIVPNQGIMQEAWAEAASAMENSSHAAGFKLNAAARTMETANGATIKFRVGRTRNDAEFLRGQQFTHVIWVNAFDVEPGLRELVASLMRSNDIPPEKMHDDEVSV